MDKTRTLSVKYPEAILATSNVSADAFEEEARIAMAMKLFELGRITSGQGSIMAGIPRIAFLLQCHRFGVSSVHWNDDNELAHEFSVLL